MLRVVIRATEARSGIVTSSMPARPDEDGNYSIDLDLSEGVWSVVAIQTSGGEDSAESPALTVTVDTIAPIRYGSITPGDYYEIGADTFSAQDQFFYRVDRFFIDPNADPTVPGQLTFAVDVSNSDVIPEMMLDPLNNLIFSGTFASVPFGISTVTVKATDVAGNVGENSFLFRVGTSHPTASLLVFYPDDSPSPLSGGVTANPSIPFRGGPGTGVFGTADILPNADVILTAIPQRGQGDRVSVTVRTDEDSNFSGTIDLYHEDWILLLTYSEETHFLRELRDRGAYRGTTRISVDTQPPAFTEENPTLSNLAMGNYITTAIASSDPRVVLSISDWETDDPNATITHSVIGTNSTDTPPFVCDGMYLDSTGVAPTFSRLDLGRDITLGDFQYILGGVATNHYICATATDAAGNVSYAGPIGPIQRDVDPPAFENNHPQLRVTGAAADGMITGGEGDAEDLIDVGNTHSNDIISFDVISNANSLLAPFCTGVMDSYRIFPGGKFSARDLFGGNALPHHYVCVRLSDAAGHDSVISQTPLYIRWESIVDLSNPSLQLSMLDLVASDDTGESSKDNITNVSTGITLENIFLFHFIGGAVTRLVTDDEGIYQYTAAPGLTIRATSATDDREFVFEEFIQELQTLLVTPNHSVELVLPDGEWDVRAVRTVQIETGAADTDPLPIESPPLRLVIDTVPPRLEKAFDDREVETGQAVTIDNIQSFFSGPGSDFFTYSAVSSGRSTAVVAVDELNNRLTVTSIMPGTPTITVTAQDRAGNRTSQSFDLTILPPPPLPPEASTDRSPLSELPPYHVVQGKGIVSFDGEDALPNASVTALATPITPDAQRNFPSAVAGASVSIDDTRAVTTVYSPSPVDQDGNYLLRMDSVLAEGEWEVVFFQTLNGVESRASFPVRLRLDSTPPTFTRRDPALVSDLLLPNFHDGFINSVEAGELPPSDSFDRKGVLVPSSGYIIGVDNFGPDIAPSNTSILSQAAPPAGCISGEYQTTLNVTLINRNDGNYYVCTRIRDRADNQAFNAIGPIVLDTVPPAFTPTGQPRWTGVAAPDGDGTSTITLAESAQGNIIDFETTQPTSDIVAFAVLPPPGGECGMVPDEDYLVLSANRFNPADLIYKGDNYVCTRITDLAGNTPAYSAAPLLINNDITSPALREADLDAASDTGRRDDDNITANTTLSFSSGENAQPNALITLGIRLTDSRNFAVTTTTVADTSGNYALEPMLTAEGVWVIFLDQTPPGGRVSISENNTSLLLVDTTAPGTEGRIEDLQMELGQSLTVEDLGNFFSDDPLSSVTPSTTRESFQDRLGLSYRVDFDKAGVVIPRFGVRDRSDLDLISLNVGIATITVTAEDAAGNSSAPQSFQVEVVPPKLIVPDLDAADDTGADDTDNVTNQTDGLTFSGNDALPGALVTVTATPERQGDDVVTGTATVDATGNYFVDLALSEGAWNIRATQTLGDATSIVSAFLRVVVDTSKPSIISEPTPVPFRFSMFIDPEFNIERFFSDASPMLTYSEELENGLNAVVADLNSANILTIRGILPGTATIIVTATDVAGNTSEELTFSVAFVPPVLDSVNLDMADDGSTNDNITNKTSGLTITGSDGVPGATITVTARPALGIGNPVVATATVELPTGVYFSGDLELSEGLWDVVATQTVNGVTSDESTSSRLIVDTTPPIFLYVNAGGTSPAGLSDLPPSRVSDGIFNAMDNSGQLDLLVLGIDAWTTTDDDATITHSLIASASSTLTCNGTDEDQDIINVNPRVNITIEDLSGDVNVVHRREGLSVFNYYICATATDLAGNEAYSRVIGPILSDITLPTFLTPQQPRLTGAALDGSIVPSESDATNLINVPIDRSIPNDIVSFAVLDATTSSCENVDDSAYRVSVNGQFDAEDLIHQLPLENHVCVRVSDTAGNTPAYSENSLSITIGTTAIRKLDPPLLAGNSDSGESDMDRITNVTTALTFEGNFVEAGASVTVTATPEMGTTGDPVTATKQEENESYSVSLDLTEGEWGITATQTVGDDTSQPSDSYTLVIDTTAPGESSMALDTITLAIDTSLPIDDVSLFFSNTQSETLMYSASATAGINTVGLFLDQDNNLTVQALEVGTATITLEARDIAGNSDSRSFQIEVTPPPIPNFFLSGADDLGSSSVDGITSKAELRFFAFPIFSASAVVTITATPIGTTDNSPITVMRVPRFSGQFEEILNLQEGVWDVTVSQTDPNAPDLPSPESTLRVEVDTTPPAFVGDNPTGLNLSSFNLADTLKAQPPAILEAAADVWIIDDPRAIVTHSVIGTNAVVTVTPTEGTATPPPPPVVCNGTDGNQDQTPASDGRFINQRGDINLSDLNYRPMDLGFGNHYICATATDVAGNSAYFGPLDPIAVDTFRPAFLPAGPNFPGIGPALNPDTMIPGHTGDPRTSTDILSVNNAHPNDIIAFAVEIVDPEAPITATCAELPEASYGTGAIGAQFDAADLIGADFMTGFSENRVCIRLSDEAGNPEAFSTAGLSVNYLALQLPAPRLDPDDDFGLSNKDGITNELNVTIIGSRAVPGAVISLIGTNINFPIPLPKTTAADTQGDYMVKDYFGVVNPDLIPGSWDFVVIQTPPDENAPRGIDTSPSPDSPIFTLIVDTDPPTLSAVMIDDLMIDAGEITTVVDLGRHFSTTNAEYDTLTYTGASTNDAVATATVDDNDSLMITGLLSGTTTIALTATDRAGNTVALPFGVVVGVATLTAPDLDAADDTGLRSADNITKVSNLTFSGEGAEPNATISITATTADAPTVSVMTTADASGNYFGDLTLSENVWEVGATQTVDGETSVTFSSLRVTVDTTAPATVRSITDVIAVIGEPTMITDAARYFDDVDKSALTYTAASTDPNIVTVALEPGTNSDFRIDALSVGTATITITATDVAGNPSNQSFTVTTRIRPPSLLAPDLDDDSNSGSNADNVTNLTNLTFNGSDALSDAAVTVKATSSSQPPVTGTGTVDTSGNYAVDLTLSEGVWDVVATQTVQGQTSSNSPSLTVTVDTTRPTTMGEPGDRARAALVGEARILTDAAQYFQDASDLTYTAASADTSIVTVAVKPNNGLIDLTFTGVATGTATIALTAADTAGNERTLSFTVTTRVRPPALDPPNFAREDDTGSNDRDNRTKQTSGLTFRNNDALMTSAQVTVTVTASQRGTDAVEAGMATAAATTGVYSVDLTLSEGEWDVVATQTVDRETSLSSPIVTVIVDTTVPSFLDGVPTEVSELGARSSDGFFDAADAAATAELVLEFSAWQTNDTSAIVTHSVIGNNSTVTCNGTDQDQDLTDAADEFINRNVNITTDNFNYEPDEDGFGNHYICATVTDVAGNASYSGPIGPVQRDTGVPAFANDRPALINAAADGTITQTAPDERLAVNLIEVGNTHPNDTISFAFSSTPVTCTGGDIGNLATEDFATFALDQIDVTDLISDSENYICVSLSDEAMNPPAYSALQITNQVAAGQLPALDLASEDDTGKSDSDNITMNASALTVKGSGARPGNTVRIIALTTGSSQITNPTADPITGDYFADLPSLSIDGEWTITATQTVGGVVSPPSPVLTITVDTAAPSQTPSTTIPELSRSPGETVAIANVAEFFTDEISERDELEIGFQLIHPDLVTADLDDDNNLTVEALQFGTAEITLSATDEAGNVGELTLTITVVAPRIAGPEGAPNLDSSDDDGIRNFDNITKTTDSLTFVGSVPQPNAFIMLTAVQVGTPNEITGGMSTTTGDYRVTLTDFVEGVWEVVAQYQYTPPGQSLTPFSLPSNPLTVTVDTTPLVFSAQPQLQSAALDGIITIDESGSIDLITTIDTDEGQPVPAAIAFAVLSDNPAKCADVDEGDYKPSSALGTFDASRLTTTGGGNYVCTRVIDTAGNATFSDSALLIIRQPEPSTDDFVTIWETATPNETITIPTFSGTGTEEVTYNYTVDWGDPTATATTVTFALTGDATHTYAAPGEYTVRISGDFPRIYFNDGSEKDKIIAIDQWGDQRWTSMEGAFYGAANLAGQATDNPDLSNVTNMSSMFQNAGAFNQDIGDWDVRNVTNMLNMFSNAGAFNQDIGRWDVGSVTNMNSVFNGASAFNQDIGGWDVSNVTNMNSVFEQATTFNQDIGGWNVGSVTNMNSVFEQATTFNQDIGGWNVGSVTNMNSVFNGASAFNQDIGAWDVSAASSMINTFNGATDFDQDIGDWDVSNVTNMTSMFENVTLSVDNYNALLIGWSAIMGLQRDVTFHGGGSTYCDEGAAGAARGVLENTNWDITDGGPDESCLTALKLSTAPGGSSLPLNPTFDPATTEYIAFVGSDVASIAVTPTTRELTNTITVNAIAVSSAAETVVDIDTAMAADIIIITIAVTAQDGAMRTYTIKVTVDPNFLDRTFADRIQPFVVGVDVMTVALPGAVSTMAGALTYTLSPDLPAGLTYATDTVTGVGEISGIPGVPLTEALPPAEFTYRATNAAGNFAELTFAVRVEDPLELDEVEDLTFTAGKQITPFMLPAATGGSGNYTYEVQDLPRALMFATDTRLISGLHMTVATFTTVTYRVTDEVGDGTVLKPAVQTFAITIEEDTAPSFGTISIQDRVYSVGRTIATVVLRMASGGNGELAYTLSPALPSGLTYDTATGAGRIMGTPAEMFSAVYTYTATDRDGDDTSAVFTIAVYEPVELDEVDDRTFTAGREITAFTLPAATGGSGIYVYTVEDLPRELTFATATRKISGTPTTVGEYVVTYTASDEADDGTGTMISPAVQTFTITVYEPLELDMVANRPFTAGREITAFMLPAATGGSENYVYTVENLPTGLVFNDGTLEISGTPTTDDEYVVTYTASDEADDGTGTIIEPAVQTFTITITVTDAPTNEPPVAESFIDQTPRSTTLLQGDVFLAGDTVTLNGSGSSDLEDANNDLGYAWTGEILFGGPLPANFFSTPTAATTALTLPITPRGDLGVIRYSITLTVTDTSGESTEAPRISIVVPSNVVAVAGEAQDAIIGQLVTLDGGDSEGHEGVVVNETLTYLWEQVGMSTVILTNANTSIATFTAPNVTTDTDLVFQLTITSTLASSDTDEVTVTVAGAAPTGDLPVADAGDDQNVAEGALVTLDGSASDDPDGDNTALTYSWEQVDGQMVILTNRTTAAPTFTAPDVMTGTIGLTFTLTVTDPGGLFDTTDVTITVYEPLELVEVEDPLPFTAGREITAFTLSMATGGSGTYSYEVSVLPNIALPSGLLGLPGGLMFDDMTLEISGTATTVGTFTVEYTASDTDAPTLEPAVQTFAITIYEPLELGEVEDRVFTVDSAITSFMLTVATGGSGNYVYTVEDLPTGLEFDGAERTIFGTPATAEAGTTVQVTYRVTDEVDDGTGTIIEPAVQIFTITLSEPLELGEVEDRVFTVGSAITPFMLTAASGGSRNYVYTVDGLPDALTFEADSREISGTPNVMGTFTVEYTASDDLGDDVIEPAVQTFAITVRANQPPTANAGMDQDVAEGEMVTLDGRGSSDPEGQPLTYQWTRVNDTPTVVLTNADTATPTFIAPTQLITDVMLAFSLTVTDSAGADSAPNVVTITVAAGTNDPPTADAGLNRTVNVVGTTVALDGSGSSDPEGQPLTYLWEQVNVTLTVALTNAETSIATFTVTRAQGKANAALLFRLTVNDGVNDSVTNNVTITIGNEAPRVTAVSSDPTTAVAGGTITLSATVNDPDNDPLTYEWSQVDGIEGSFNNTTAVSPIFTASNTAGQVSLRLVVDDGRGGIGTSRLLTITVDGELTLPAPGDQHFTRGEDVSVTLPPAAGGRSPYTYELTGDILTTLNLTFDPTNRRITVIGDFGTPPTYTTAQLTYTVTDSNSGTQSVFFDVTSYDRPLFDDPLYSTLPGPYAAGESFSLVLPEPRAGRFGAPPQAYTLTLASGGALPAGLSFDGDSRTLSGTPPIALGTFSLTYQITDRNGAQSERDFDLTITNTPPTADAGDDRDVEEETQVTLDGGRSDDPDGDNTALTYLWTQTGGTPTVALD